MYQTVRDFCSSQIKIVRRVKYSKFFSLLLTATCVLHQCYRVSSNPAVAGSSVQNLQQCPSSKNASLHGTRWASCLLNARRISGTQPVANNDLIPSWANLTQFEIGQQFAKKNIGYLGIGHFFALIFENFIPDIKDVLLATGSSRTTERAVKRYIATATQVLLWYRNSLSIPEERETLIQSLETVRTLHIDGALKAHTKLSKNKDVYLNSKQQEILEELWMQSRHEQPRNSIVFDERFWEALEKDLLSSKVPQHGRYFPDWQNTTGTPISQFAQSLTQFSFVGLPVLFHKELGISQVTREELSGFVHMWAVLGHALGIKDEVNICLSGSYEESIKLFKDIYSIYFLPALFQFDWRTRVQLGVYLDSLHRMDNVITPRLITYRFLRDIVKGNPVHIFAQMNPIEKMYLAMIDSLLSNNLDANRFFINRGGMYFLDVNGYHNFGSYYANDARKSRGAFYTRDRLVI